jgi:hypothetical protein
MLRWSTLLQFPLLYLSLCVYGLGVFGSDFDVLAGRLFIGLVVGLCVLDRWASAAVGRLAGSTWQFALVLLTVLLAAVAYRPLHLGYWDEHSTPQAAAVVALGLCSWALSRLAAAELVGSTPRAGELLGALLLIAGAWASAWFYPMLPFLGVGAIAALGAAAAPSDAVPREGGSRGRLSAFEGLVTVCIAVDLFLVLWDFQWLPNWAPLVGLSFALAGVGYSAGRRAEGWWLLVGALNFGAAVAFPEWVLHPGHAALVGLALGALLSRVLHGASEHRCAGRAPLGGFTGFWILGVVLGMALYQNLAFAGWRALLLVPAVALGLLDRRRPRSS